MKLTNGLNLFYWHIDNDKSVISLEDTTRLLYIRPSKQLIFKFYRNHEIRLRSRSDNPLIFNLKKYEKKVDVFKDTDLIFKIRRRTKNV